MERPKCQKQGCDNLAMMKNKRKDDTWGYDKLCSTHHRLKHGMKCCPNDEGQYIFPNVKCDICGWDKAPCDRHRIKYGSDGGRYTKGNIMVLCPNCHRMVHLKRLVIK